MVLVAFKLQICMTCCGTYKIAVGSSDVTESNNALPLSLCAQNRNTAQPKLKAKEKTWVFRDLTVSRVQADLISQDKLFQTVLR